jgi:hypothetical protein
MPVASGTSRGASTCGAQAWSCPWDGWRWSTPGASQRGRYRQRGLPPQALLEHRLWRKTPLVHPEAPRAPGRGRGLESLEAGEQVIVMRDTLERSTSLRPGVGAPGDLMGR